MKNICIDVYQKIIDIRLDVSYTTESRCTNSLENMVVNNVKEYTQEFTDNMWHSIMRRIIMKTS